MEGRARKDGATQLLIERERDREREGETEVYFKELAHAIAEAWHVQKR